MYMVLILGGRYGTIDEESKLSYTEIEYNYAVLKAKTLIVIVLDDSVLHKKAADDPRSDFLKKGNMSSNIMRSSAAIAFLINKIIYKCLKMEYAKDTLKIP